MGVAGVRAPVCAAPSGPSAGTGVLPLPSPSEKSAQLDGAAEEGPAPPAAEAAARRSAACCRSRSAADLLSRSICAEAEKCDL